MEKDTGSVKFIKIDGTRKIDDIVEDIKSKLAIA
jgi:hypothetical protein